MPPQLSGAFFVTCAIWRNFGVKIGNFCPILEIFVLKMEIFERRQMPSKVSKTAQMLKFFNTYPLNC